MRRALVLALCLLPVTAVAQQDDRGFLTRLLEDNLSGAGREVRIEGFQGALSSRASLSSLTIADDQGIWLRLTDVTLDWNRAALLRGAVDVSSLTAAEIVLERLPAGSDTGTVPSPEATAFALPELPVSVRLGEISAQSIRLGETVLGRPVSARLLAAADLSGGEGSARVQLDRTDAPGSLRFSGSFANDTRRLALELSATEPPGGIAATALGIAGAPAVALNIGGEGPLDGFEAAVSLATDGQDRMFGVVALQAPVEGARRFRAELKGDIAPLFLPDYRSFFGPEVALVVEGQKTALGATELSVLQVQAASLKIDGTARIAADGMPERLGLELDLGQADGAPVLLPVAGDPVRVGSARLRLGYDASQGGDGWRLKGVINGLDTVAIQAETLELDGSGRIARQPGGKRATGGTLRFSAQGLVPADPALRSALGGAVQGNARFHWVDGAPLALSPVSLQGDGYALDAALRLTGPATQLSIEGRASAQLDDMARLSGLAGRSLGGAAALQAEGRYAPLSGAFDAMLSVQGDDLRVAQPEADALLSGKAELHLQATRDGAGTEIRRFDVATAAGRLSGGGWLRSSGPDLQVTADLSDLSFLGQGRGGSLQAHLGLVGTDLTDNLRLVLQGKGRDLRPGIAELDGLLRGETGLDVVLRLDAGVVRLDRAVLDGQGWGADAQGQIAPDARGLRVSARLDDLSRLGSAYRGRLAGDLDYALADGGETLRVGAEGAALRVGIAELDRLLAGTTRLGARLTRRDGAIRVQDFALDNPQLSARADGRQTGGRREVSLSARLTDLGLLVPGVPGPLTLSGQVVETDGQLRPALDLQGPGGIAARLQGDAASDFSRAALRLTGNADAALANAFLGSVAVRGPVRFDLALNGRPGLEALSGEVALSGGRLTVADPPFAFSGVEATARLIGAQAQLAVGAVSDAGGRLDLRGGIGLRAPFASDLRVALQALVLRDPSLYQTKASGELSITGPLTGGARIAGAIALADTELRIPSSGLGGVAAIPDLRHVGEPAAVRRTRARAGLLEQGADAAAEGRRAFGLDIAIAAPNRVFVRGRGLDAELGGDFRITGTTADVVPSGGLELIRGRMDLLGKRFAFTEGRLQMEGSLIPTIRLVANTDTVDGTASVIVDGPADAPTIRFLSQPELPEEEVVARLLFGRGLTSLTPVQAAQLASAVATLTGKGGSGVVDRLRRSFGLDDFDVSAGEGGGAAVRAGKYLSENVYVDLKVDSEGKSEVSINLDLSPSVTIRGRGAADGNTGIGIHFERDY